ncbi:hypothetical protein OIU76_029581 [Salix suchowensis]|nr:hypothetical protein OIU76_029581 [Salix suchowensis]
MQQRVYVPGGGGGGGGGKRSEEEIASGMELEFAHGIGELRPVIRHPRYKTQACRMVLAGGACPYGHRCHFRHSLTDQDRWTDAAVYESGPSEGWCLNPMRYRQHQLPLSVMC